MRIEGRRDMVPIGSENRGEGGEGREARKNVGIYIFFVGWLMWCPGVKNGERKMLHGFRE